MPYSDWLRRIHWDTAAACEDPPLLCIRSVLPSNLMQSQPAAGGRNAQQGAKQGTVGNEQTSSWTNPGCQENSF